MNNIYTFISKHVLREIGELMKNLKRHNVSLFEKYIYSILICRLL